MRNRMYGGVRGRKTKVGGKPTFGFLLLDCPTRIKSIILKKNPGALAILWILIKILLKFQFSV